MNVNKATRRLFRTQEFQYFLCKLLSLEFGIYIPKFLNHRETWRAKFQECYRLRYLWYPDSSSNFDDDNIPGTVNILAERRQGNIKRYKINVYAKFRPIVESAQQTSKSSGQLSTQEHAADNLSLEDEVQVTLPLHQRLSMIKMSHGITSNRQALKILASEGGWFAAKWTALANRNEDSLLDIENRSESYANSHNPVIGGVKVDKLVARVQSIDGESGKVMVVAPDVGLREFAFDGVLPPSSSQQFSYDVTARNLVADVLNGLNATILVYGQTSSGKTYAMFGPDLTSSPSSKSRSFKFNNDDGIVPRACTEIFEAIENRRRVNGIVAVVAVSYVEIYGDRISDLLRNGERCGQSKVAAQQYVLQGAAERPVESLTDINEALAVGDACKRRAATAMNDRSTRAHNIFILSLKQTNTKTGVMKTSKLFLADLGGSEQIKKSLLDQNTAKTINGPNINQMTAPVLNERVREAVYINLGLLALKKCIEALNTRSEYVPFQDSKLTMLLSAGLGGNSKTSVIICSRLETTFLTETIATLRFGEKCSLVVNQLTSEDAILLNMLKSLDQQIKHLESIIQAKERWDLVEDRREDILAEEGTIEKATGGIEIRMVTRLTGAESERRELEVLLKRRLQFIGVDTSIDDKSNDRSTVLGFGKELAETYGIGEKYSMEREMKESNERFLSTVKKEKLPTTVKSEWVTGEAINEDSTTLEKRAIKAKRNKLKFAGLSL